MAIGKNLGANSQSSNDFLEPLAPTGVTPSNVTSRPYNDGAVSVSFSLPANSPAATSYTVTATQGGQPTRTGTSSSSPVTVTGLVGGLDTFITMIATNDSGDSPVSDGGQLVVRTVPATMSAPSVNSPAPSAGANQSGATYDTVSWTAPANGGSSITLYRWTSSDGKTGTTTGLSVDVSQEGGTAQTYQVRAENANGSGVYSTASGSVTTFSFTPFSFVPFGAFGFSPFNAFTFSPFNAFSFSPFNAFGFTPFNFAPFSFAPFNFAPR
jgi:hypothetical protein